MITYDRVCILPVLYDIWFWVQAKQIIDGVYRASNYGKGLGFLLLFCLGFTSGASICIGGWIRSWVLNARGMGNMVKREWIRSLRDS
jgi:hypothetical protein